MRTEPTLILDSRHGVYIPEIFGRCYEDRIPERLYSFLQDPEREEYWNAWEWVLDNVTIEIDGQPHYLWHDGDLWAIPDGIDFDLESWIE